MRRFIVASAIVLGTLGYTNADPKIYNGALDNPVRNIADKEVFHQGFPNWLMWRHEKAKPITSSYEVWSEHCKTILGSGQKYISDEQKRDPELLGWASRFQQENPEKLLMCHLNFRSRRTIDQPQVLERYFPGHWVYTPGCMLGEDINESVQTVKVENAKLFKMKAYTNNGRSFSHRVILVELNEDGTRDWYNSEYATVEGVDYEGGTITLNRGAFFSTPRSFDAKNTYIAPLAGDVWGDDIQWQFNQSSNCPKDKNGMTAGELEAEDVATMFAKGGVLQHLSGVTFDVNFFTLPPKLSHWDTDNDGVSDGGFDGNVNRWREGVWQLWSEFRRLVGDDFIITADGGDLYNQQAMGIVNGIESEGLVFPPDGWRGFSRPMNLHTYWQKYNPLDNKFSFIVLSFNNEQEKDYPRLGRFCVGTSAILGINTTWRAAEHNCLPPKYSTRGSLGYPTSDIIRVAKSKKEELQYGTTDLFDRIVCEDNTKKEMTKEGIMLWSTDGADVKFKVDNIAVPAGDITFFLNAKSLDALEGTDNSPYAPRHIVAHYSTLPVIDAPLGPKNHFFDKYYNDLFGLIGTQGYSETALFYRRPGMAPSTESIDFNVTGAGRMILKSMELYNYPDVVVRSFEDGIVVVNPALENIELDLSEYLPKEKAAKRVMVPYVDALFIEK